jgi:hypothetical protein
VWARPGLIFVVRLVLRCDVADWEEQLRDFLKRQVEVDLVAFDYEKCGAICESLAREFTMEMALDRDPLARTLHFRKIAGDEGPRIG